MARTAKEPRLEPGRIYRTQELARFTTNLSRLTRRLLKEKKLVRLAYGFYLCPDDRPYASRFLGAVSAAPPARPGGPKAAGTRRGSLAAREAGEAPHASAP